MYAIIRTGGKQAKVRPGDVLEVELLKGTDDEVTFTPLLVVDGSGTAITDHDQLGDMPVTARVLGESKGPKVDIFKYKSKTGYRRRMGHRQRYTQIEVVSIAGLDEKAPKKAAATKKAAPKEKAAEPAAPASTDEAAAESEEE